MLLSVAAFYLVLGLIGTCVHILRSRPNDSVNAFLARILLLSSAVLLPFAVMQQLFPSTVWNYAFAPVGVYLAIRIGQRFVKEIWREANLEKQKGELA